MLEKVDDNIGYSVSKDITELEKLGIRENIKDNITIEEKVNVLKEVLDNKTSAVEIIPILQNYSKSIFGENTQIAHIEVGGKVIAITKIVTPNEAPTYLYKINSEEFKITNDIKSITGRGDEQILWKG